MSSDDLDDGGNFLSGKSESLQQPGRFFQRVSDIVPFCQFSEVFRAMTDKDADVVHPGGGVEYVVVEGLVLRKLFCDSVEARLMAKFVGRIGLGANVIGDRAAVTDLWHGKKLR